MTTERHLTRRTAGIVVGAAIVYAAAANSLVLWLYAVTAMILSLIPLGIAGPILSTRPLNIRVISVTRHGFVPPLGEDRNRMFRGDEIEIVLSSRLDLSRSDIALHDSSGAPWPATVDAGHGDTIVLRATATDRGRVHLGEVSVSSSWPLGLLQVRRRQPIDITLIAHPRYAVAPSRHSYAGEIGGETSHRRGHAEDVVALREYRSGDSRRQVHWPTSARFGQLMVVERAAPASTAVRCHLQLDPNATPAAIELAVGVAATVAATCAAAGQPCRLAVNDGGPDARRWSDVLGRLALLVPAIRASRSDANLIVSALADAAVVDIAGRARHYPSSTGLELIASDIMASDLDIRR